MITYSTGNKSVSLRDKIVMTKVMKSVSRLPKQVYDFLWNYNVIIHVCNVKDETNVLGRGFCIFDVIENTNDFRFHIYIDTNEAFLSSIYFVLCHEIGHFFDRVIGCIEKGADFSIDNLYDNAISKNNKVIQNAISNEHDFFLGYNKDDEKYKKLAMHDFAEIFADSFAELLVGSGRSNCPRTKQHILNYMYQYIGRPSKVA